jgi:imidazole glycerol phosphate synthase, glutamine amidotransferase subunit
MKIGLIAYRGGNVRSIRSALESLGVEVIYSRDIRDLGECAGLVFPGVGAAAPAMEDLRCSGLADWIPAWERPFLGICLGMQLLCEHSEEGEVSGLGVFPVRVERFQKAPRIPHIGWNTVELLAEDPLFLGIPQRSYFYFVHSYRASLSPYTIGRTTYGEPFSAAMRRDNFWGVQFHPEKSSSIGLQILANFVRLCSS